MKKFLIAAALAFAVVPAFGFVNAASAVEDYGSIGGGNIVTSKNVTKNGTFADVTNATCSDIVKIRAYVHNPGPNSLTGVRAQAVLPTGQATSFSVKMTISAANANPKSESDTTSIKSDKSANISYVAGTAEYFDANGARLGSLSDSIVTTGADVPGGVDVSTMNARYVQFQAKLNCETPPPVTITVCDLTSKKIVTINENAFDPAKYSKNLADCAPTPPQPGNITVCEISTKKIITIKETDFNDQKYTKDLAKCAVTPVAPPTSIPNTGAGAVMGIAAAVTAIGAIAHRVWTVRRMQ